MTDITPDAETQNGTPAPSNNPPVSAPIHACTQPKRMGLIPAILLVLFSVALLCLAVPPYRISWLAWFALAPALVAMRNQGAKRGALLGFIFGMVYDSILLYWLVRFGPFTPSGAAFGKCIYFVLMGIVLGVIKPKSALLYAITASCTWLGQEYLEASGSVGFTLGMLANTQARHPLWLQINSLFGAWTLSLVLAFVNATVAAVIWERRVAKALQGAPDCAQNHAGGDNNAADSAHGDSEDQPSAGQHCVNHHSEDCHGEDQHGGDCHSEDQHGGDCHSVNRHSGDCHSVNRHSGDCHSVNRHSGDYHSEFQHGEEHHSGDCHSEGKPAWYCVWRVNHPVFAPFVLSCVLIVATFGFGIYRVNTYAVENERGIKVGLVQLSAPQEKKFDPQYASGFLDDLFELSRQTIDSGCSVVIWPETSVPYNDFVKKRSKLRRVQRAIRENPAYYMLGTVARDNKNCKRNRMYAFNPSGKVLDHYDKEHLVPFGEFLPLEKYWPDWRILDQIMRFAAGEDGICLKCDGAEFGVLICFESMTTTVPRQRVQKGAELLVVPTNDAWFGTSAELPAHFDMAILRAVELGRYTMQVGNTGISGYVNPLGEVLQESKPDEKIAMSATVYPHTDMTLYAMLGDLLPCFALLWVGLFLVDRWRRPCNFWEK